MSKNLKILGVAIVSASILLMVLSSLNDSPTNDEVAHIGAGYSYLVKHNLRLNAEHPPLVKDISAVPLLFMNIKNEIFQAPVYWLGDIEAISQWAFGHILLFKLGNNADKILQLARLPILIFFVLAALLLFKWAFDLYGSRGAITALILFCFSPTVLAHGHLVTTDMAITAAVIFSVYLFLRYLEKPTQKNLILIGVAFGVSAATKFSALLLIPFFIILSVFYAKFKKNQLAKPLSRLLLNLILIVIVGFVLIVTPIYYFNIYNYNPQQQATDTKIILTELYGDNALTKSVVWLSDKPVLRIYGNYLLGLTIISQRVSAIGNIYFLDELKKSAGISYFPIIYVIKEPLPWLVMLGAAILMTFRKRNWENNAISKFANWARNNFTEFSMLLWVVIYWAITLNSHLQIGVRHLLPIYPFVILLVASQAVKIKQKLILNFGLPILLIWYITDAFVAYPNYIPYYSEIVGGSTNGYKYAVDSNLDWGQDLKRLSQWAKDNNIEKIEIDYFGWNDPEYYLGDKFVPINSDRYKNAKDFQLRNQSNGWLAVSATTLFQRSYGAYTWLRPFVPTTSIGNSIYIWQF